MADNATPLAGFCVLDLSNVLAGPFCCHQLAHLGADVIKVEVPDTGDLARQLGADADLNASFMGVSFLAQNSGKRSVTINLKSAAGKEILKRLVARADVLVENFRPGVMDRLGVGYEVLKSVNPNLVYCAISGFGQDGPWCQLPAYDQIVQGMSGVMSITGDAETAPYRVGYPMADTIGGMTAAFAISAALADRSAQRGRLIDVSMLESVVSTMGWVISNFLIAGQVPQPMGNNNFTASPSGTFKTADGIINLAANKQEQFAAVCKVVGCPELVSDVRFAVRQQRLDNRAELAAILEQALLSKPTQHWLDLLADAGVPAGPVYTVPEVLAEPQLADRGLVARFENAEGIDRDISIAGSGFKLDGQAPKTHAAPPMLGADTDAVLAELGYSQADIEQFHSENAV